MFLTGRYGPVPQGMPPPLRSSTAGLVEHVLADEAGPRQPGAPGQHPGSVDPYASTQPAAPDVPRRLGSRLEAMHRGDGCGGRSRGNQLRYGPAGQLLDSVPVRTAVVLGGSALSRGLSRGDTPSVDLTVRLTDPQPRAPTSSLLARAVVAAMLASAAAIASLWPFWQKEASTGLIILLVAVTFAVTAAILSADSDQRGTAQAIALAAVFYLISWWWAWPAQWQVGPLPLVSFVLGYLWFTCGGLALIRYPEAELARRYERWFFVVLVSWICGLKLLLAVVSQPAWAGYTEVAW